MIKLKKIIKVEINSNDDLYEKYNKDFVSRNLIEYLIVNVHEVKKRDNLKIIIENNTEEKDIIPFIKKGLRKEIDLSINIQLHNNIIQFLYLLVGFIVIFLSTLINEAVIKEVVLISGWVFIWVMFEIEIYNDSSQRRKRNALKKLLKSHFEIKK